MSVLLFLAVYVAVEIYVLVLVGQAVGFLGLLGLLLLSAVVGAWALKHEGRRSVMELGRAVQSRRPAEAEVASGMYVALAGVLLVVPGILSTVAALVLLVPPVRHALARRAAARAVRAGSARMGPSFTVVGVRGPGAAPWGPAGGPGGPDRPGSADGSHPVIEGRVVEQGGDDDVTREDGPGQARGTG